MGLVINNGVFMRYFSLIILFFVGINLSAQSWEPVGAGITRSDSNYDAVMALYSFHGRLYIGGKFVYSGTRKVNSLACWNGTKIDTVGKGVDSIVSCFAVYNGDLIIGGKFNKLLHTGRTSNFIMWNDSSRNWSTLEGGLAWCKGCDNFLRVFSLCEFKNELYAGGGILGWDEEGIYCIEKWDGKKWTRLLKKTENALSSEIQIGAKALIMFRGKLYIGSSAISSHSLLEIAIFSWDGSKMEFVGKEPKKGSLHMVDGFNHISEIKAFAVHNGSLYAAGSFDSAQGKRVSNIAKWNDTNWSAVGTGVNGVIYSMTVFNNKLYVGGQFDSAGGKPANNIAVWDGNSWLAIGEGLQAKQHHYFKGRVAALAVYKNELYAGGTFDFSGTTPLNNLAKLKLDGHVAKPKPTGRKNK